jgi:molybdate transport system permease protein
MGSYSSTNNAIMQDQESPVPTSQWVTAQEAVAQPVVEKHAHPGAVPRWVRNTWRLAALPLLLFFLIPLVVLVAQTTPARIFTSLQDKAVYLALAVSLKTTIISLGIILLFGSPLAFLLARYEFRYKSLVDTLIDIPTVLPPSVAGLALLLTFGRNGPLGHILVDLKMSLAFTQAAVVMAQVFIAAPYYVRSATLGFAAIDSEYIQAAQLDGAGRWQILRYLVIPLAQSALIGGALLSWARALGEFGATILFAGNFLGRTQTMPLAIYLGFESNLDVALTLSVILVLFSFSALIVVKGVLKRNGG